jgi:tricorn protease
MPRARYLVLSLLISCSLACPPAKREKKAGRGPFPAPAAPLSAAALEAAGAALPGAADVAAGYPRFPHHHRGVVVFAAEEDLWQVSARGGLARRLTTHAGVELFPRFSPDGKHLAFSGEYDGNQDVYVMPAVGGAPRRLTFHPGRDQVLGWTPDGKQVLFRSTRHHPHHDWTLHTIPLEGGDPVRLPLFRAARLTREPGGKRVAINRVDREFRDWKRYAGGTAAKIFVGDLDGGPFRRVTTFKGTNAFPMWHGGRIYFLSDRTGTANIWSMTPEGTGLKQHTRFDDYDVRFPSLGDGKIAFQHRAEIYLYDLRSGRAAKVPLRIASDALQTRTRFTDPVRYLTGLALTPDGKRVGLEIRGNLHLIPAAKEGRRVQVTIGSDSRERGLSFSDDGKTIAATSDRSGETEIYLFDSSLKEHPTQVTQGGTCYKLRPAWAPGGKLIAFADTQNKLYVVPARKGSRPVEVDASPHGPIHSYSWSPDGRWLAYTKADENYYRSIFVYDSVKREKRRVTGAFFHDREPTWSPDGKYLAFLSERTINPYLDRLDAETIIDRAAKPYLVLLSKETHSPFLPGEKDEEDKGEKGEKPGKKAPQVKVTLDLEGIEERIVEVPVPAGNYGGLTVTSGEEGAALFYVSHESIGMADWERFFFENNEISGQLMRFDFKKKKAAPFAKGVVGYDISRDGKTVLLRLAKNKFYAFKLGPKAPEGKKLEEHALPLKAIREQVDPRTEWRQMFNEAWRMMRDLYWSADMGKVDWEAMGKKYAAVLPRVATRDELEDLIGEMVSELSLGHTYVWGGDKRRGRPVPVGLLGADLEPHQGRYRFARIYSGESWDKKRRSPLTLSHARVKEGEYLIKIDGREVQAGDNVYSRLQKSAGELVQLAVADNAAGKKAREVEITTLRDEKSIRYFTWVKRNRERVAEKTGGKVGYLHLPDMMTRGMVAFDRWYYPQVRKQGLIVDARWNRGGFVSEMLVKRFARRVLAWQTGRRGYTGPYPENTLNGRIVVLTNERAGSDGDIFPRAIQVAKLGPVIGTRTWGGVVGISLSHPLVDKGISTRPRTFAFFDFKRRWGIEGEGVQPDIEVDNDPAAMDRGVDAQLDRGIVVVLDLLKKNPPRTPDFEKKPDKRKKTWTDRYGQTDKP